MTELASQVDQTIQARKLLRRGERILVAVSGGLDSMVLLDVLFRLASAHSWKLTVAHFNHQLRGRSSDADERLVRKIGGRLKIPIVVGRAGIRELAKKEKLSIEMAARKARHNFLAKTAVQLKAGKIAVAHHADDQLELFFLRLLRGAGADGVAGMKWRGPSPTNPRIQLVRPLLDQTKVALREYASEARVEFREDATNASMDFGRNRIRHELLPLLRKDYQPALDRTIPRLVEIIQTEGEFVRALAQGWLDGRKVLGLPRDFEELPLAVQRRCVQLQLIRHGIPLDYELIEELRSRPEHPVALSGEDYAVRDRSGMVRLQKAKAVIVQKSQIEVTLKKKDQIRFGGMQIAWQAVRRKLTTMPTAKKGREVFDADKVGPKMTLRHWQAGDRFQPIGMGSAVKLQDLFTNQKVPREKRHDLILGVTEQGEIFWVEDLRISEKYKLTDKTIRCLQWQWKRL